MRVKRLDIDAVELGNPDGPAWLAAPGEVVSLVQAPAAMQPTKYIAHKWQNQVYGQTRRLAVKGLRNATEIAFRLEWEDKSKNEVRVDNTDFPDAVAMLFPLSDGAPLIMGGEGAPVNLWYWRADHPQRARSDIASGIGTSQVVDGESIAAQARHKDGHWAVVLRRAMQLPKETEGAVQFVAGQALRATFAVWDGGNLERAGIKAFSPSWLELSLEA